MDQQPILEDKAIYFKKTFGLYKGKVTARLLTDHVEFIDKSGQPVVNFPISTITDVKHVRGGLLRIHCGEERHGLQFVLMPYRLFGLIGFMLSGGPAKAKAWAERLGQLGLEVRKGVF